MKSKKQILRVILTGILILSLSSVITTATAAAPFFKFIEAESGTNNTLDIIDDSGAYNGKAIKSSVAEQKIEYKFTVPEAGTYLIWARVYHETNEDNSYFFSMDGDDFNGAQWIFDYYEASAYDVPADDPYLRDEYNTADLINFTWYWIVMTYRDGNVRHNTRYFELAAGEHTLMLQAREIGAVIDKLIITNDLSYAPDKIRGDPEAAYVPPTTPGTGGETAVQPTTARPTTTAPPMGDSGIAIIFIMSAIALAAIIVFRKKAVK